VALLRRQSSAKSSTETARKTLTLNSLTFLIEIRRHG
jgi:hypothetical protein